MADKQKMKQKMEQEMKKKEKEEEMQKKEVHKTPDDQIEETKKEEPKAEEPKKEEPKAEEPKKEEPKKEEPKKEEPKKEAPKAEEPKKEAPKAEEPKKEEPKKEEPKKEGPAEAEEKPRKKKKGLLIAGVTVVLLAAVYVGLSFYFMDHFSFRTTINGVGVSADSVAGAKAKVQDKIESYELKILSEKGTEATVPADEFDLVMDGDKAGEAIRELMEDRNGFTWVIDLFRPKEFCLNTSGEEAEENRTIVQYDRKKLLSCLKKFDFMDKKKQTPPENAKVSDFDPENGFTVVEAKVGTQVDQKRLLAAIDKALASLDDEIDLSEDGCYARPKIDNDNKDLLAVIEKLNKTAKCVIRYEIGEQTETLDAAVFADWMDANKKTGEIKFDEEKVAEYVAELGKKYNTCYTAKKLMTSYEQEVTIENSHYGWKVDEEAETAQILKELKKGKDVTRDLNYSMTGNSRGENDYGDSYVEINLTTQHLFLHKDGKVILDSDLVSGNISRRNGTPCGAFTVTYTQRNAILRGPGYASPVKYWMPFYGDYGMHDASWRSSFGGKIYRTNGSHGCVNLPTAKAEVIFETVEKGWPVLIYELDAKPLKPADEPEKDDEKTEEDYKAEMNAAAEVVTAISDATEDVTAESGDDIEKARKMYNALSAKAKEFVTNYKDLESAEKKYEKLKKEEDKKQEAEDRKEQKQQEKYKNAAAKVDAAIEEAIGAEVTLDSERALEKARSKYEALADDAKAYVKNYKKLSSAEAKLQKLKQKEEERKQQEEEKKQQEEQKQEETENTNTESSDNTGTNEE